MHRSLALPSGLFRPIAEAGTGKIRELMPVTLAPPHQPINPVTLTPGHAGVKVQMMLQGFGFALPSVLNYVGEHPSNPGQACAVITIDSDEQCLASGLQKQQLEQAFAATPAPEPAMPAAQKQNPASGVAASLVYRFVPTRTRSSDVGEVQLQQVRFIDQHGGAVPPLAVKNPGGNSPAGEGPSNAGREDRSKWLDFRKQPLEFTLPSQPAVAGVVLVTANDFPDRDPVGWRLEVGTRSGEWTVLHDTGEKGEPGLPTDRHTTASPVWLAAVTSSTDGAAAPASAAVRLPRPPLRL